MKSFFFAILCVLVSVSNAELTTVDCTDCGPSEMETGTSFCLYTYIPAGGDEIGSFALCVKGDNQGDLNICPTAESVAHLGSAIETGIEAVHEHKTCDNLQHIPAENSAIMLPLTGDAEVSPAEFVVIPTCGDCIAKEGITNEGWCQYIGGGYCGAPTTDGVGVCDPLGGISQEGIVAQECPTAGPEASTVDLGTGMTEPTEATTADSGGNVLTAQKSIMGISTLAATAMFAL